MKLNCKARRYLSLFSCNCVSHMINYVNFKLSKDVQKNPGPTQYNNDHHEVIIRPFMQNVQFMRDNPGRFIESNTENSWLRYLNNMYTVFPRINAALE